jgi:hypothetical protein
VLQAQSTGLCGDSLLASVNDDLSTSGAMHSCVAALPADDLAKTASTIKVDGHDAFLPSGVFRYSLGLTEPLVTSVRVRASGDVSWTESATLLRCKKSDSFPPSQPTCGGLASTGVGFARTTTYLRDGHQTRIRDSYTSTDGTSHAVDLRYLASFVGTGPGAVGYRFPGRGAVFEKSSKAEAGVPTRSWSARTLPPASTTRPPTVAR